MSTELQLQKWQKTIELLAELYGASSVSIVELKQDSLEIIMLIAARLGPQLVLESMIWARFIEDYNAYCCQARSTVGA